MNSLIKGLGITVIKSKKFKQFRQLIIIIYEGNRFIEFLKKRINLIKIIESSIRGINRFKIIFQYRRILNTELKKIK